MEIVCFIFNQWNGNFFHRFKTSFTHMFGNLKKNTINIIERRISENISKGNLINVVCISEFWDGNGPGSLVLGLELHV